MDPAGVGAAWAVPAGTIHERGTFLQRSGVTLFLVVTGMAALALGGLFAYVLTATPPMPTAAELRLPGDTLAVRVIVAERQAVFGNFVTGVKELVVAFFLPLITGVLGYIFGTRGERGGEGR